MYKLIDNFKKNAHQSYEESFSKLQKLNSQQGKNKKSLYLKNYIIKTLLLDSNS